MTIATLGAKPLAISVLSKVQGVFRVLSGCAAPLNIGDILADAVQGVTAAGADGILNVDDRLDARQMDRQGSAVPAPLGRAAFARGRIGLLVLGVRGGLSLFGLFEPEQQLILRQALGAATEAVTLHRLDDLLQPFSARPLSQDHGLEQIRIVGESLRRAGHKPK